MAYTYLFVIIFTFFLKASISHVGLFDATNLLMMPLVFSFCLLPNIGMGKLFLTLGNTSCEAPPTLFRFVKYFRFSLQRID
jgi:hypothetical protein